MEDMFKSWIKPYIIGLLCFLLAILILYMCTRYWDSVLFERKVRSFKYSLDHRSSHVRLPNNHAKLLDHIRVGSCCSFVVEAYESWSTILRVLFDG